MIKEKDKLLEKARIAKEDIKFFERKGNKLLADIFQNSDYYYPICHNDSNKKICDHCMDCWDILCNRSNCDRTGRCLCPGTLCICLGRK